MKFVFPKTSPRACPYCGSSQIARSHRQGLFEYLLYRVLKLHPYRCLKCDDRHYSFRRSDTPTHPIPTTHS